jgi:hypothetical protein
MSDYIEVDGLRVGPCMWRSKVEEVERLQARVAELEAEEEGAKEAFGVIVDKMKDLQSRNLQIEKTIHRQVIEISRLYRSGARPLSNDADKAGGDL